MTIMLLVILLVCFVLLAMVSGVRPLLTEVSRFELERLVKSGDEVASAKIRRLDAYEDIVALQKVIVALLLVLTVALSFVTFGWLLGVLVACLLALFYGAAARLRVIREPMQRLYERHELAVLDMIERFQPTLRLLRTVPIGESNAAPIASRDELLHLVEESGSMLTHEQKMLIIHGLQFDEKTVESVMTPRSVIDAIAQTELLGPLVLDQLHKTGHSRFPVTDGDIDHVVGMLHIKDLLTLDSTKKSLPAGQAMERHVYYIHQAQTLGHALAAFLRTRHHLFVVVNEFRETVGLVSLEDVLEALLGRKIVDEFDTHEDLRAVASRNPRRNNMADTRTTV